MAERSVAEWALGLRERLSRLPDFPLVVLTVTLFVLVVAPAPRERMGDGSEYYALFFAWEDSHRPWMTDSAYRAYDSFASAGNVGGALPADLLRASFPALQVGETADFNHFWFYSLLAYLVSRPVVWVGIPLDVHESFLLFHLVLLLTVVIVARRLYGWSGVACVYALTFVSPVLWFGDKVHTEFFTHCTALTGIMLGLRRHYAFCALLFGACATQNPSFAVVAVCALVLEVLEWRHQRPPWPRVVVSAAAFLLTIAHPLYYQWRLGEPTPQLLAGGADPGANLGSVYVWLIDPDIGLLPNWPLGLFILIACSITGAFAAARGHWRNLGVRVKAGYGAIVLVGAFLVSSLYAQSSTENLNSGSLGVARYALWYTPMFFPLLLTLARRVEPHSPSRVGAVALISGAVVYAQVPEYLPERQAHYTTPTRVSVYVQRHLPWLYSPPAEIFLERYSGGGETEDRLYRGVLGPDCRKLLVIPGPGKPKLAAPSRCGLSVEGLRTFSESLAFARTSSKPFYVRLRAQDIAQLRSESMAAADMDGTPDVGAQNTR